MMFNVGAVTDTGRVRLKNQDNFVILPESGLFVVADGMGGHLGGETASQMTCSAVTEQVKTAMKNNTSISTEKILVEALEFANQSVHQLSTQNPQLQGMGTTVTALLFFQDHLKIAQVGDSRCYLLRNHNFWQLSRDHSLVEEKFRAGLIERDEMRYDTQKNVITRSVGYEPKIAIETFGISTQPGDLYLICSDGLSGQMEDVEIFQIIEAAVRTKASPQDIAKKLVQEANTKGGDDNVTSVVIEVL